MKAIGRFFLYMGRDILRGIKEWAGTAALCLLGTVLLIGGVMLITYGLGWIAHTFIQPLEVVTFGSIFTMGAQLLSILMVAGMVIFLIIHTFIPIVKWIISLIKRARHG